MKILVAGDFHGNIKWALRVIKLAKSLNIKHIIQLGDFGVWPGKSGKSYLDDLSESLQENSIELWFLGGNHEDWNQLLEIEADSENWIDIEGGRIFYVRPLLYYTGRYNAIEVAGKRLGFVSGAVSIDRYMRVPGQSWWFEESLTEKEAAEAKKMGKVDYLFTHDCPSLHPFASKFKMVPDPASHAHRQRVSDVAKVLDPVLWFHGHMHWYAEYTFGPDCKVYGLDCDGFQMKHHAVILDIETGEVNAIN